MCKCLKISRGIYYYAPCKKKQYTKLEHRIKMIFYDNLSVYGTRKLKKALLADNIVASRRKIGRIMKKLGLVSTYTIAQYKPYKQKCNNDVIANELNREFSNQKPYAVVVSDLTYVRVNNKWNYICILVDLYNREIIGHSAGVNKDAALVYEAFASVKSNLHNINLFHSDRGSEFKNHLIDEVIKTFNIKRSLSNKGCPYDNAVAEATFKTIKIEFCFGKYFKNICQLRSKLSEYIHWFNNKRMHGSLNYHTPAQYRQLTLS